MPTPPTVVCPVDFSEHSRLALRVAAAAAARVSARLVIVHVIDPLLAAGAATRQVSLDEEAETELKEAVAAAGIPTDGASITLTEGAAGSGILSVADAVRADLIVMGTHGLTGYRKLFFGSTTEQVLRATRVPVLAVPSLPASFAGIQGPIIAPVDFSAVSVSSARIAAGLGSLLGLRVVLLHVNPPVLGPDRWRERAAAANAATSADAARQLADFAGGLGDGTRLEATVVAGSPPEEISNLAVTRGATVIVMGLRGAGGLFAPAVGSTAYRVLTLAPVPVLAIPTELGPGNYLQSLAEGTRLKP